MAGNWGGQRANAGRKPGSKNRPPRVLSALARHRADKLERIADAKERARAWLERFEGPILDEIIREGDPRTLLECLKLVKGYADGPPRQRIEINVGPSPSEILREIARERAKRAAIPAVALLSPGEPDA